MRGLRFGVAAAFLLGLIYLGGTHGVVNPRLPGIASFLNPFSGVWQQAGSREAAQSPVQITAAKSGEIVIDERGIPHLFAADVEAVFYLQGYMHARDRLFQMDLSVRAAGGRLAEILGLALLARDRVQRRKGMRVAAALTAEAWQNNPESAAAINAYTAGVNAYLDRLAPEDYPVEFKLLGFAPERWTPFKSALFSKSMAETLCFRHDDIAATNARKLLGDSLFQRLYPELNPEQSPVISSAPWAAATDVSSEILSPALSTYTYPALEQSPEGIGSNNWALAGSKTASGSPLLSNDPHLNLTLPSIWYEVQLAYGDENVYGVSLPALPGILIGFNTTAAWGITNVGQDVADWYRIDWTDSTRTHYWLDSVPTAVVTKMDTIIVKGADQAVIVATPWTVFGPVVYDQPDNEHYNLALRWAAHDTPFREDTDNLEAFMDLAVANDLEDYLVALRGFDNPGSNVVYANQDNDIALTVTGHFPARKPQQGRFVQDGSKSASAWPGFIPYAENARDVNPERQFVASANQRSTDASYPYYYLGGFDDYRGRYINRHLEKMEAARPEDMMALQYDAHSLRAEEITPLLLKTIEESKLEEALKEKGTGLLQGWDYVYRADSQAPILFDSWIDSLYRLTFDEIYALDKKDRPVLYPETWRFLELLETAPNDPIFDHQTTPQREQASDLIVKAYQQALRAIDPLLKAGTSWSEHRGTRILHLARIPGFGSDLIHSDGRRDTPNALSSSFGPSWRMVVSLERPIRAWGVLPGGSSGNVGSPFYTEGIEEWSKGEYFELKLYQRADDVMARERLIFKE